MSRLAISPRSRVAFSARLAGLALFALAGSLQLQAANWYLNSAATGLKTGKSWADAWTSPSQVVWGSTGVKAGDTLYISGGTTTRTYNSALTIAASGSAGNPVTIKLGQDAGHNGIAILPAISINTRQYIVIDGARDPFKALPDSVAMLESVTNNMGINITNPSDTGIYMSGTGGNNNTLRWLNVGPIGSTNNIGDVHAVRLLNLTTISNLVIENSWIHDVQNDGINLNSVTVNPDKFDAFVVRRTIIERTGDDGIQGGRNGLTISHCILRDHWIGLYNGHPDQIQLSGATSGYIKILNNIVRNKSNSLIIGEHLVTEGGTLGPIIVAGNVFYNTRDWVFRDTQAYGATFMAWRANADVSVLQATYTNIWILNNTMYFQRVTPLAVGRASPDGNTRSVWMLDVKNSAIRNNLLLDCGYPAKQPVPLAVAGAINSTNGMFYTQSSLPMTHNVVAGANTRMSWGGVIYATGEELSAATGLPGNRSAAPSLVSTNNYDFRLAENDTVLRDNGFNLSAFTNAVPELMKDLYGTKRAADGFWDIGAAEYAATPSAVTEGLVVHLNFEDNFADGIAEDSSGRGNSGIRFGHLASPTNWPTASTFVHPVTGQTERSAKFRWYAGDGWGTYSKSGDYVAITNIVAGGLQNMETATVALWVKRDPAPDGDRDGINEWNEDQGRYICSGYGYTGTWTLGMFSDRGIPYSGLRLYTADDSRAAVYVSLGEATRVVTSGNKIEGSLPWTHMAFTFNRGLVSTFTNGKLIATTNFPINALTVRGPNGSLATGWIGLGCDTHNGRPALTPFDDTGEQYPNHAFFAGDLDDVRIYSRALSAFEVESLYSGKEPAPDSPPTAPTGLKVVTTTP